MKGPISMLGGAGTRDAVFEDYTAHYSERSSKAEVAMQESLLKRYPEHHLTCTSPRQSNLAGFAAAGNATMTKVNGDDSFHFTRTFALPVRRLDKKDGKLVDNVSFGKYTYSWKENGFIVYVVNSSNEYQIFENLYILAPRSAGTVEDGHHSVVDSLLMEVGKWSSELHEEIYTFDQGMWQKNPELWKSIKDATWDEVILEESMKASLIEDVEGFFDKEELYKQFTVPWKRGIIFHGVPGNGKTLSLRALIKSLYSRPEPIPSLYVKSFESQGGAHQFAIQTIFSHARSMAPCLLIFEDIDSLVQENCRSYFLNEVDGLESNDGILIIGSTNHLAELDVSIVNRPSRFDRKYHFKVPGHPERTAYSEDWRKRLANNTKIDFSAELCSLIADISEGFSYAYLKELFISTLLTIARDIKAVDLPPLDEAAEKVQLHETRVPESLKNNEVLKVAQYKAKILISEMNNAKENEEEKQKKDKETKNEDKIDGKLDFRRSLAMSHLLTTAARRSHGVGLAA